MKKVFLFLACLSALVFVVGLSQLQAQENIIINPSVKKQSIDGFGGSIAYYENWLVAHSKRTQIYDLVFKDLGISILRLRNSYMNEGGSNQGITDLSLIIKEAQKRGPIDIMISSWSPAGAYKSNGKPANDETMATLATDTAGNFVYDGFANWWYQSLLQYKSKGIDAKYISIQNEPNWGPGYEGCIFMPQEQMVTDTKLDSTYKVASYATAFSKVYDLLDLNKANLNMMPKLIGPEVLGIENAWSGKPSDYTKYMDMTKCYAMAHHLYTGGVEGSPNSYVSNLSQLAKNYPDKPRMQTEYSMGDWYATAMLIHNSLVYEGVSAYLLWDIVWPGSDFLDLENPWTPGSWKNTNGYKVGTKFYSLKQYAAFIKPGWSRIDASNSSLTIKTTAFLSPDESKLTIVMINTSTVNVGVLPDPGTFYITGGNVYRTSATENCILAGSYVSGKITLPPKSVTTLLLEGSIFPAGVNASGIEKTSGVYPNPVTDESVLQLHGYSGKVDMTISNSMGQIVHHAIIARDSEPLPSGMLSPGIYFIHLSDGFRQENLKILKN
jgi:glucuronoarabinoxylan endo-1,4-beta-xylanase